MEGEHCVGYSLSVATSLNLRELKEQVEGGEAPIITVILVVDIGDEATHESNELCLQVWQFEMDGEEGRGWHFTANPDDDTTFKTFTTLNNLPPSGKITATVCHDWGP